MRFEFIHAEKANFPITILCRVLEVSRSGYYQWVEREVSERRREDAKLLRADLTSYERTIVMSQEKSGDGRADVVDRGRCGRKV